MRRISRALGITAGIALLVLFGSFRKKSEPVANGTHEELSIGLWCSPWFTASETMTREAKGRLGDPDSSSAVSWSSSTHVEFVSWSWLALVAAIVLLRRSLRRSRPPPG
jgi:hypothetical protein